MGDDKPREDGFELHGEFYRWQVTDQGKDLMLIDRLTGMPIAEFFELIEDSFDRGRAPILLAMIATSIRAKHPDWTVERIYRTVTTLSLGGDVTFIEADVEEDDRPGEADTSPDKPPQPSTTTAEDSSSLSTRTDSSPTSATLSVVQA